MSELKRNVNILNLVYILRRAYDVMNFLTNRPTAVWVWHWCN